MNNVAFLDSQPTKTVCVVASTSTPFQEELHLSRASSAWTGVVDDPSQFADAIDENSALYSRSNAASVVTSKLWRRSSVGFWDAYVRLNASVVANTLWQRTRADPYPEVIKELKSYAELEADWDSEDAVSPFPDAISSAEEFVRSLPPLQRAPTAVVASTGEVGVYWRTERGYVQVYFYRAGMARLMRTDGALNRQQYLETHDFSELLESADKALNAI